MVNIQSQMAEMIVRIRTIITLLLLWGLPVASYAQAPDLSLPPLPLPALPGQGEAPQLPAFGAPVAVPAPVVPTMETGTPAPIASRADESSLDALLPPVTPKAPPESTLGVMGAPPPQAALPPLPDTSPVIPQANSTALPPNTVDQPANIAPAQPAPSPRQVMMQQAAGSQQATPRRPKTLEEEAAAAGIRPLPVGMPVIPGPTAQALLSGSPLREEAVVEEDAATAQANAQTKEKPTYRDLPKLKSSIRPLSLTYNYQRQVLPPAIYRKQYSPNNRHLPTAQTREDYDRHLFGVVAANDVNATRAFLEMGKSVDMVSPRGDTLLMTAVRYGALDTARLLVARGANPALAGNNGQTPLSLAQQSGQQAMVLVLQARGA